MTCKNQKVHKFVVHKVVNFAKKVVSFGLLPAYGARNLVNLVNSFSVRVRVVFQLIVNR